MDARQKSGRDPEDSIFLIARSSLSLTASISYYLFIWKIALHQAHYVKNFREEMQKI